MAFSGALTLTDLNDFITPAQACIKPVEQTNKPEQNDPGAASTEIRVDSAGSYYEVATNGLTSANNPQKKLETAQISLNDCLACSGCITSAESVLITLQSHTEVLNALAQNPPPTSVAHKTTVISISPQTLASLSASLSSSSTSHPITLLQILRRVKAFCTSVLGFDYVYDTTFARHITLLEHAQEFKERKREGGKGALPMLASACPGWVCYAEKTHSEMLPFISRTKSPQQVMGTLVKEWLGKKWGKTPDQVYHVTVMPCYDKKLEASRQDFYNEVYGTRDVDCVITTGELDLMMREKGWDLSMAVPGESNPRSIYWNFENAGVSGNGRNGEVKEEDNNRNDDRRLDQNHEGWDDDNEEGRDSDSRMTTTTTATERKTKKKTKKSQTPKPSLTPTGHSSLSSHSSLPGVVPSRKEFVNGDGRTEGKGEEGPADGSRHDDDDDNLSFSFDSFEFPELVPHPGSSSGSYLHSLISMIASESVQSSLFSLSSSTPGSGSEKQGREGGGGEQVGSGQVGSELELKTRMIRSLDYEEFTLVRSGRSTEPNSSSSSSFTATRHNDDNANVVAANGTTHVTETTTLFRGAKCYGFRNLQNLVRKVGREAGVQVGRGAAGRLPSSTASRGRGRMGKKGVVGGEKEGSGGGGEGGYDYVEVMACPGGCVNGGGQLRPPHPPPLLPLPSAHAMNVDEEGFKRDWEGQDVSLNVGVDEEVGRGKGQGGKWGDKEWIKKVEAKYWDGSPPLPPPPLLPHLSTTTRSINENESMILALANTLAAQILKDLCHPSHPSPPSLDSLSSHPHLSNLNPQNEFTWTTQMDPQAESKRQIYFRTQYHAVENEVVGLAVKW